MSQPNNKVAVLLPMVFRKTFDYRLQGTEYSLGDYVQVPFGNKKTCGVIWDKASNDFDDAKIKPIDNIYAHMPPMSEAMRKFIDWVSWYTLAPAGQVLKMAIPIPDALKPVLSDKWQVSKNFRGHAEESLTTTPLEGSFAKGELHSPPNNINLTPGRSRILAYLSDNVARTTNEIVQHARVSANIVREFAKAGGIQKIAVPDTFKAEAHVNQFTHTSLSPAQASAADTLRGKLAEGFSVSLVDGVTGSGKTEVYFDTIEACIKQNKQSLVMLPEIALSVQWLSRFEKRFGFAPHVWHSSVSPAKKRKTWQEIVDGSARVVVGARSALFLPFKSLGFIVVDEEHDASYKQEEGVIYHARDMAVVRSRYEKIPIALVSATPSLETEFNCEQGRYHRLHLPDRHNEADMPEVKLIDMRQQKLDRNHWISNPLREALLATLAAKNQSMVFMNRRGYAPLMLCRACGHRFQCPDCTAWLVLHRSKGKLLCHHCGHTTPLPHDCPDCKAENTIIPYGTGVERIAEELRELFPQARVELMTSDFISEEGNNSSELINAMIQGKIDILVGTQMVAKGHHFAGLALVGVIDADMGLGGGDLRTAERTYQLLHQLSGRAGREKTKGTVYLQTYMPDHAVMLALKAGDRDRFMQLEARMREDAEMPPYGKLAAIIVEGKEEREVQDFARELVRVAATAKDTRARGGAISLKSEGATIPRSEGVSVSEGGNLHLPPYNINTPLVLGPAPAPLSRIKNRYRYRILIKAKKDFALQEWISRWLFAQKIPSNLKVKVDIEPYSFV